MDNPMISIIIPVYNVMEYLEQCLSSVLNQTYSNIEVVLVNDGSTDGSGTICKSFAEKDSRIKLLTQNNQGLTKARKNGAAVATGEYLAFVDADDYIEKDLLSNLIEQQNGYDLIIYRWIREEDDSVRFAGDSLAEGEYKTPEDMRFLFHHLVNVSVPGGAINLKPGLVPFVWNKLFKTSLSKYVFEEIDEEIDFFEDCDFSYRYLLKCTNVLITDIYGYHYRIRKNSICHTADSDGKFLENIWKLYKSLYSAFSEHNEAGILVPQLETKILALFDKAPHRMGFSATSKFGGIVFPFINVLNDKRVVLYGAGVIGKIYWYQINKWHVCNIVCWVDNDCDEYRREGLPVFSLVDIDTKEFDFIVIASYRTDEAEDIRSMLMDRGYCGEQILWKKPLEL